MMAIRVHSKEIAKQVRSQRFVNTWRRVRRMRAIRECTRAGHAALLVKHDRLIVSRNEGTEVAEIPF